MLADTHEAELLEELPQDLRGRVVVHLLQASSGGVLGRWWAHRCRQGRNCAKASSRPVCRPCVAPYLPVWARTCASAQRRACLQEVLTLPGAFEDLGWAGTDLLAACLRPSPFLPGHNLCRPGQLANGLWLLQTGLAAEPR